MADNDNEEADEAISHDNESEFPKDGENEEGTRGNDWEFVSLSASAHAATPSSRLDESVYGEADSTVNGNEEAETSRALFISGHFAFPPSLHENLPIAPETVELPSNDQQDDHVAEANVQKEGEFKEKIYEGLDVNPEMPGTPLPEDKDHMKPSTRSLEFNEPTAQDGPNVDDNEQDLYGTAVENDLVETSDNVRDPLYAVSLAQQSGKEDEADDSELPSGVWWKRGVDSLCARAKETSTFWSIFIAAAVMGLVVLGQQWQQERWQLLHQRWQLSIGDEKPARILSCLKDVIVAGSRRTTYVTASSTKR